MATAVLKFLNQKLPTMPEEVSNLLNENLDEMTSASVVYEAVGDHLQASVEGLNEDDVQDLCEKLMHILHNGTTVVSTFRDTARKLEQTVDMSAQANVHKKVDSIWKVTAKDVPVMSVDKKKLAKAEERSQNKAVKQAGLAATASLTKKPRPQILATASQAINRRDAKADVGGLDIKLENVDTIIEWSGFNFSLWT